MVEVLSLSLLQRYQNLQIMRLVLLSKQYKKEAHPWNGDELLSSKVYILDNDDFRCSIAEISKGSALLALARKYDTQSVKWIR